MSISAALVRKVDGYQSELIFVNYDGHPSYMMPMLNNYKNEETVCNLFELGDALTLDENLEKSVFYCRDKGKSMDMVGPFMDATKAVLDEADEFEYVYKYDPAVGEWVQQ